MKHIKRIELKDGYYLYMERDWNRMSFGETDAHDEDVRDLKLLHHEDESFCIECSSLKDPTLGGVLRKLGYEAEDFRADWEEFNQLYEAYRNELKILEK